MKTPDDGLVAAAWAPCHIETRLRNVPVTVDVDTDYPFRETITVKVAAASPVRVPLVLRVPAWARSATIRVGRGVETAMTAGSLHRVEREWSGTTELTIRLVMSPKVTTRYNGAAAVERGAAGVRAKDR